MSSAIAAVQSAIAIKNILFTTDFSRCAGEALPYAESLAERFGAHLHLCHVITPSALISGAPEAAPYLYEAEYESSERDLKTLCNIEKKKGLKSSVIVDSGPLKGVIADLVEKNHIDLVVAATHGHTGVTRLLLGSSVEEICRTAPCPVLTIGPFLVSSDKVQFRRILVPTDLSAESMKVLPHVASMAQTYGSAIMVLNVLPPEMEAVAQSKITAVQTALQENLALCETQFLVECGDPAETILRVSREKKADLIAIGIRNAFAGPQIRSSIAYRVMAGAYCPVLTSR